ncbi:MAG: dihydropteroate synthase [Deltaproteobacteria bacterium]|nr:dihydropteroate synthase [Deltaproteobacteria bacterium]MCW8893284.1 dihydropteroate synthase [Deltaproteobacteria bacterium]MCW9049942.1 dihydropteroate synthase [Deltaproteobacteria bacterium]
MSAPYAAGLRGRGCQLDLRRPCMMGILNVTPDSFSDGGRFQTVDKAVRQGMQLLEEGACLLDIGGESSRPGAQPVSTAEELKRILPVIEGLRQKTDLPLSIDTNKATVAREAIAAGANFINDISGLNFDPGMAAVAAETGAGLFLMHTRGRPEVMQQNISYRNLLTEVIDSLRLSLERALIAGVEQSQLAVDPGIGFGKSAEGNLELLHHLEKLHQLNYPVLLGTSRKSFLGTILNLEDPLERLSGTLATVALGVSQGVQIFRVHDVRQAKEAALVAWAIREQCLP